MNPNLAMPNPSPTTTNTDSDTTMTTMHTSPFDDLTAPRPSNHHRTPAGIAGPGTAPQRHERRPSASRRGFVLRQMAIAFLLALVVLEPNVAVANAASLSSVSAAGSSNTRRSRSFADRWMRSFESAISESVLEPLGLAGPSEPERPLADALGADLESSGARAAFSALTPAITSADFLAASPVARDGVLLIDAANVDPRAEITFDGMPVRVVSRDGHRIVAIAPRAGMSSADRSHAVEIANPDGFRARVRTRSHIGESQVLDRWRAAGVHTPSTWFTGIVRVALVSAGFPNVLQTTTSPTDALITKKKPTFNGSRVEGTVRVFEGQGWTMNGGTQVTADIYVVGTPTIRLNGNSSTGGTVDDGGSPTPSNYQITLNGNVQLPGRFHIRADAVPLPADIPTSVPNSPGTRDVTVNNPSDVNITNWNTVRDLTVNGSGRIIDVPPGNYRKFTLNGSNNRLNFTAGTYTFKDRITLNGGCTIRNTGAVTISTTFISMNGCRIELGTNTAPSDVRLNVVGNQHIQFNGNSDVSALVRCSNSEVTMNGTSRIRGQLIANGITCNGGTLITGDAVPGPSDPTPPQVSISSPANNLETTDATIVVTGTASDNLAVTRVSVNGTDAVLSTGAWSIAGVPLAVGANTITATAFDAAGNQTSASVVVNRIQIPVDQTPPDVVIVTPANGHSTEEATIAVSGTAADPGAYASGVASVTVNGAPATRDAIAGTWTANVALSVGANTITVTATDNAGNPRTVSISVTRTEAPPVDATKPVITIASPGDHSTTFDTSITVTGTADDLGANATGVRRVFVNGHEAAYDAATKQWTATGVALASGENRIVAEAEDGATPPNTERAEITVTRRVVAAPTLTISNPAAGSVQQSPVITVAGQATSGASDVPVTVTVNGQPAAVAGGQYTKTVDLTAILDPQTHTGAITVVATDSLGQVSQQAVTVVGDFGTNSAPSVAFTSAPSAMQPGGSYTFAVDATDNVGISAVVFATNGVPQSTVTAAPFTFVLTVPLDAQPGIVTVSAVATDLSGQTATAVVESGISGPGGVAGFAFDDATGFGLAGVSVVLGGGAGQTTQTGSEGAFTLDTNLASGVARLSKAGYTPVERAFAVSTGGGVSLFDSRLTPFDANVNAFNASGMVATGDGGRIRVSLGAGAFDTGTDVRVTGLSQQGLANLLPFGWSPVPGAIVDVRAAGSSLATGDFPTPAELNFTTVPGLPANVPLVLARYDETSHRWTAVAVGLISGEASLAPAFLPGPGQYAFLVPDSGDTAPPAPAFGQPLPAGPGADPVALDGATATATTTPSRSPISVDAKGTVTVVANSTRKLPSGLWTEVSFDETYNLLTGNPVTGLRASQDIVVYAFPDATAAAPNRLGARFTVKPSRTDLILGSSPSLTGARVVVTIRSGRAADDGTLVGASGGTVETGDGAALEIPSGALSGNTPVFVETVPADGIGLTLPAGYQVVGAVDVDLSGATLSTPARLAVPAVAGGDARVVVAKVILAGGLRGPKVVARARESAGRLQSDGAPVAGVSLDGVRTGGRYIYIRIPAAFGWIAGTVSAPGANPGDPAVPAGGVRVTVDKTPFLDVTADAGTPGAGAPGADPSTYGRYVVIGLAGAGAAGQNAIEAVRLGGDATGGAAASLAAEQAVAGADVLLASVPLGVAAVTPANGSLDVSVASAVTVTFTKPVLASSVNAGTLRLLAGTAPVAGTIAVLAGGRVAVFSPAQVLAGSTAYTVAVTTGVRDVYGQALAAEVQSGFTTAAAIPVNRRLQPGQVRIGYPDGDGYVTVTAPAGAIPEGSVVVVINNQTGASVTVVATSAALSVRILASVGDEIVLIVRQPDGVEYQTSQGAYRNEATGFTAVGSVGGVVVSDDGALAILVPRGAITGQAEIKVSPRAEADMPFVIDEPGVTYGTDLTFASGLRIESQGDFEVTRELHVEAAAPAGAAAGAPAVFLAPTTQPIDGNPVEIWEVITSGRVEDGKVKSNSPPFSGLSFLAPVVDLWVFFPSRARSVTGYVVEPNPDGGDCGTSPVTGPACRPVPGVLCLLRDDGRSPLHRVAARTQASGVYSFTDFRVAEPQDAHVEAIDEAHGRRAYAPVVLNGEIETRWLQGLQGFDTRRADIRLPEATTPPTNSPILRLTVNATNPDANTSLHTLGIVPTGAEIEVVAEVDPVLPPANLTGQVAIDGVTASTLAWSPVSSTGNSGGTKFGAFKARFNAAAAATYTIRVDAYGNPGNPSTRATDLYNFAAADEPGQGVPVAGVPPFVLDGSVVPADGATEVDGNVEIQIGFSEPVHNLAAPSTIFLRDVTTGEIIGGRLRSGATIIDDEADTATQVLFKPSRTLVAGFNYELVVTSNVRDSVNWHLDQEFIPPVPPADQPAEDGDPKQFQSTFTVFAGGPLTDDPLNDGGFRIAMAGQYAVTIKGIPGGNTELSVYDFAEPDRPRKVNPASGRPFIVPQRPADVAMAATGCFAETPDGRICARYAVVATSAPLNPEQPANLWIVRLDDVTRPEIVGVTSLYFPLELPSNPLTVELHEGRAYVSNTAYRGVIVVDVAESVRLYSEFLGGSPNSYPSDPMRRAVTAGQGFGFESKIQTLSWNTSSPASSSTAMSLAVLPQSVPSEGQAVAGAMPVAFVADMGARRMIVGGFPSTRDGVNNPPVEVTPMDDRLLNWNSAASPAVPTHNPVEFASWIRAVEGVRIGTEEKDLAVVGNATRLWIYDVTNPLHPVQYPSKTFAQMGLNGSAGRFELEGTLAYVGFENNIAVIDFSDPANPRLAGMINGVAAPGSAVEDLAVKDGFVYSLSPSASDIDRDNGVNVSLARPAAQLFVHGKTSGADLTCSNPVIIARAVTGEGADAGHAKLQDAEVFYQIYGIEAASSGDVVTIRRNGVAIATVSGVRTGSVGSRRVSGTAIWPKADGLIDATASYTVEITAGNFTSAREPMEVSTLIAEHDDALALQSEAQSTPPGETVEFGYILAGHSNVKVTRGAEELLDVSRPLGLHADGLAAGGLAPGVYPIVVAARLETDQSVTDQVTVPLTVTKRSTPVRAPGATVVSGVELATGNLALGYGDVSIPGRAFSLTVDRAYNGTNRSAFSPFGYGWKHTYQVLLTYDDASRTYDLELGDGQIQTFDALPSGGTGEMVSRAPYHTTLVRNADGSLDFFTKSRDRMHFNSAMERSSVAELTRGYMGNLQYMEDTHGNRMSLHYDERGRLGSVTDASNRSLTFTYEEAERVLTGFSTPAGGNSAATGCLERGQFARLRTCLRDTVDGARWRITRIDGPGGLRVRYGYDSNSNLIRVERDEADGGISEPSTYTYVWEYTYNPGGGTDPARRNLLATVKEPNGHVTTYGYDFAVSTMPVVSIAYPESVTNTFAYTGAAGAHTGATVTDGEGVPSAYTIEDGYVTAMTKAGATWAFGYDAYGVLTSSTDAEGQQVTVVPDAKGNPRVVTVTGADGRTITTTTDYDLRFSIATRITDPNANVTVITVDPVRGDVMSVRDAVGVVTTFGYFPNGDLSTVTEPLGQVEFGYDAYGNTTSKTEMTGGDTIVTNALFDVRSRAKTMGGTHVPSTTITYDSLDRPVSATASDPAGIRDQMTVATTWKPGGQIESETRSSGGQVYAATYSYDDLNRTESVTEQPSDAPATTVTYGYDGNSNIRSYIDRSGIETIYSVNLLNQVTAAQVTAGPGDNAQAGTATYTFAPDKVGNIRSYTDERGVETLVGYDGLYRPITWSGPEGKTESVTYDNNGNVLDSFDRNGAKTSMLYDALDRVKQVTDAKNRIVTAAYDDAAGKVTVTNTATGLVTETVADLLGRTLSSKQIRPNLPAYTTTVSYSGREVSVTDARGVVTTETLSSSGDTGRTVTGGVVTEMRYTGFGGMRAMTDPNGGTTNYGLDGLNRTRTISDPENGVRHLDYDGAGNLTGQTDPRGIATSMRYDHLGRTTERKTGSVVDERIVYDDLARTVSRTDARNKTTVTSFDQLGRVRNVARPDATSVSYEWDGEYVRKMTDGRGRETKYDYDAIGRVTRVTDPENRITLVNYTDAPGVSRRTVTDRLGFTHVDEYDALGRLAKRIVDGETVGQYEYDGNGNRTAEIDGLGHRTVREYDALGRIHRVLHPENRIERWDYDDAGNALRYNAGAGNDVVMTYDRANRMITRTDASGMLATFRYDAAGLMTEKREKRDAYGLAGANQNFEQVHAFTHNAYGKTATVTVGHDLDGLEGGQTAVFHGTWTYGYDDAQNLATVTDALGRTTTYGWDALNRIERIERPGSRVWTVGYDADGRVANRVDAKGQRQEFDYTDSGHLSAMRVKAAGGAVERDAAYVNDPEGRATRVTEHVSGQTAVRERTYDARGRMRSETDGAGNRVAWTLDAANNVTRLDVEAGASAWTLGYGYDRQNRVTAVRDQSAGNRLLASYVWRGDDQMDRATYGNGAVRQYGYDTGNRLTSVENSWTGGSERFDYGYDVGSNRKTEERRVNGQLSRTVAYRHDVEDRLVEAAYTTPAAGENPAVTRTAGYGYDKVGNRTREFGQDPSTGAALDRTTVYNDRNEPVTMTDAAAPANSATYAHDANGNLTSILRGGVETRYAYDGRDQMTRASRVEGGVETVLGDYRYDAERRRTQGVAGGVAKRYVWAGQSVAAEVAGGSAVSRYDSGTDLIRSDLAGEGERWYGRDAMGSTTSLTSSAGALVARTDYDAWGERIAETGATANRVGFTGYREDAETGLDYAINRYYSPDTGRFTTHDPLTELDRPERLNQPQGLNLYPYVMGAPTRYTDPDGLDKWVMNNVGTVHRVADDYAVDESQGERFFSGELTITKAGFLPGGFVGVGTKVLLHDDGTWEWNGIEAAAVPIPPPPAEPGTDTAAEPDFIDAFNDGVNGVIYSTWDGVVDEFDHHFRFLKSPEQQHEDAVRELEKLRRMDEQVGFALRSYSWAAQNPGAMFRIYAHTPDADLQRIFGGASGTTFAMFAPFAKGGVRRVGGAGVTAEEAGTMTRAIPSSPLKPAGPTSLLDMATQADGAAGALQGKGRVLLLGRYQQSVDDFAQALRSRGVDAYTVSDEATKFSWMARTERWAEAKPTRFRIGVRDSLNFASDAGQILRARTIAQNTWQWTESRYTIAEMAQTSLWKPFPRAKYIYRFNIPWR